MILLVGAVEGLGALGVGGVSLTFGAAEAPADGTAVETADELRRLIRGRKRRLRKASRPGR